MLASLTLADAQIQIGATVLLIIGAFFAGWWLRSLIDVNPPECEPGTLPRGWSPREVESMFESYSDAKGPAEYTEHSPQIPEPRKPAGPFGDDCRGGEYGGSVEMLRRGVKEIED